MHKRTMTYKDYNGTEVTEDFYFNLSKADLIKMQLSEKVGLHEHMSQVVRSQDGPRIVELFEKIVLLAYGDRTEDGRFIQTQEVRDRFASTAAYSDLFVLLATDAAAAAEFINATMPNKVEMEELTASLNAQSAAPAPTTELDASAPVLEEKPEEPAKTWRDYSKQELLEMGEHKFVALVGSSPKDMPRELLVIAMERKNRA